MPPHTQAQCDLPGLSLTCSTNPSIWKKTCRLASSSEKRCNHNYASQGFTLDFQAEEITLHSVSLSSTLGAADIYVDGTWSGQIQLVPHNTPWTKDGLDIETVHNLTVLPMSIGQNFIPLELFVLTLSNHTTPSSHEYDLSSPHSGLNPDFASQKDGTAGALISIASIAAVAVVVLICSACFFFTRTRRQPGFHMPSVLVHVTASDESNNYGDNYNEMDFDYHDGFEMSTMFNTKSTWKDSPHSQSRVPPLVEGEFRYPPPPPQTHSSMIPPFISTSTAMSMSGSETPKRRLSWHEDSNQGSK